MADKANKKKSPILLFAAGFAVILLVMLIANRYSPVRKLQFPLNNGVSQLFTYANQLVAVAPDNQMYIWNWSDLGNPTVSTVNADQAVLVAPDTVVSVGRTGAEAIVVSKLGDSDNYKRIPLAGGSRRIWLGSNRDKSMVVVALEEAGSSDSERIVYELLRADWQNLRSERLVEITAHKTSRLFNVAVSDDGKYVLLTGQKGKTGWMVMADTINKVVVWDKQVADFERFGIAVFSPDGRFIYARTNDSMLYKIDAASADIIDRWHSSRENRSVLDETSVQDVGVSPDGQTVASIVFSDIYMWNSQTGTQIFRRTPQHKIESGLAFSPDSRLVATSDLRQGGTIKIWPVPKH